MRGRQLRTFTTRTHRPHLAGLALAGVLPAGAVLAGRMLGARFLAARLVPAGVVVLACYLAALGYSVTAAPARPAISQDLAGWRTPPDLRPEQLRAGQFHHAGQRRDRRYQVGELVQP